MLSALCLVIDGLHHAYVGAYGNTWIETPSLDALAARSLLLDNALSDSTQLEAVYRSYWTGRHAADRRPATPRQLAHVLAAHGVNTTLLTDEPALWEEPLCAGFDSVIRIAHEPCTQPAEQVERTQMGQLLAQAASLLQSVPQPFLLWVHSRGLRGDWDAPLALRQQYVEEEEETPPPDDVAVPRLQLADDYDPDALLALRRAYAGQVTALDRCLGGLMEALQESDRDDQTLLALTAPRGFALGDHRRVGDVDDPQYR
jgi:arylsulfatase A-like enzyme